MKEIILIEEYNTNVLDRELAFGLSVRDIRFILLFVGLTACLSFMVIDYVRSLYTLFNVFVGLALTRSSKTNPPKRVYHSLYYSFLKKTNKLVYKPIEREKNDEL